ncbi:septal ring lytic transglycosylase RlpA family protein [uncultured Methylobacterium sp.]|jgi:rare lipoprotein A|uniref:septal ring lytic transglycosylase RlpA family protein n=1 Tax=uncultured Methylobacterium sp. TaxID=157278 RepID=UPI002636B89C|nr:septal ring lytic transglycosylase RlpA family protein [uncultured Methylobacterium sp.]
MTDRDPPSRAAPDPTGASESPRHRAPAWGAPRLSWSPSPLWRIAGAAGLALAVANCAGTPPSVGGGGTRSATREVDPKYGVAPSPRLYGENDPIPKGGGRPMTGKPYVVAGKTYVPRQDARGYVREGLASWYGTAFHGRMTANGEVFDRFAVAAAHPTLPLPSYARVTNVSNGRSMVVRVNDRGPYHADRLMDVSQAVSEALGFHHRGTTRVRVEYVGKAPVAGSDDRVLMATLRDGGQRAPTSILVAEAETETRPLAYRPASEEGDAPRRASAPVRLAQAEPIPARPVSHAAVRIAAAKPAAPSAAPAAGRALAFASHPGGKPGAAPAGVPVKVAGLAAKPGAPAKGAAAGTAPAVAAARPGRLVVAQAPAPAAKAGPRGPGPLPLAPPLRLGGTPPERGAGPAIRTVQGAKPAAGGKLAKAETGKDAGKSESAKPESGKSDAGKGAASKRAKVAGML